MDGTALKVRRMPALLALLLAVFAVIPAAAGAAEHRAGRPAATSPIEAPAAILDNLPAADSLAEPGGGDPSDGDDPAILSASGRPVAPPPGQIAQHGARACPACRCATYRARAPPSL